MRPRDEMISHSDERGRDVGCSVMGELVLGRYVGRSKIHTLVLLRLGVGRKNLYPSGHSRMNTLVPAAWILEHPMAK